MRTWARSWLWLACLLGLWACGADAPLDPLPAPDVRPVVVPQLAACQAPLTDSMFRVDTLASGLDVPWRVALAPDGRAFISEQGGRILAWDPKTGAVTDWGRNPVFSGGEAGLMGLALHPDFSNNGELYAVATVPRFTGLRRLLNRLLPQSDRSTVVNRVLLFREGDGGVRSGTPIDLGTPSGVLHAGGDLAFGPDGYLYVSQGDATRPTSAMLPDDPRGKILRLNLEEERTSGAWLTYASGFRNVQGVDWNPDDGLMYAVDHGPTGMVQEDGRVDNDELNLVENGGDYGWPWASGFETYEGAQSPIWGWTPATAPGDLAFGGASEAGRDLWIAHLKRQALSRIVISQGRPVCEDWLFLGRFGRIRSVAYEKGAIFLTTANRSGHIEPRERDDLFLRLTLPSRVESAGS